MQTYDLIGDLHGQRDKLVALLRLLGYSPESEDGMGTWRHPEGRRVVFLSDYIDRGPKVRAVLRTARHGRTGSLRQVPDHPTDGPTLFCGHYWLPPDRERVPLRSNIACLNYRAAFGNNPLVAYRWDWEQHPGTANFATATL